jgi:UDP-N-acetylmuramyl pentapeptide synthase
MWAALQALGRLVPQQQGRRIAVLGDMAELGQFAIQEHQAFAPFVQQNRVDLTFLYGPYMPYLQEQLPPSIICYVRCPKAPYYIGLLINFLFVSGVHTLIVNFAINRLI